MSSLACSLFIDQWATSRGRRRSPALNALSLGTSVAVLFAVLTWSTHSLRPLSPVLEVAANSERQAENAPVSPNERQYAHRGLVGVPGAVLLVFVRRHLVHLVDGK